MRVFSVIGRHVAGNLVGYLALVVALGGTGYAAATINSADVQDNSLRSADIRNDASAGGGLTAQDLRASSVRSSEVRDRSVRAADLSFAARGARAYAYVKVQNCSGAGSPVPCPPARSKSVTAVERVFPGTYCVTVAGISSTTALADVSVEQHGTTANWAAATAAWKALDDTGGTCDNSGDFVVLTATSPEALARNAADNGAIAVTGSPVLSNQVSFTIVIP